MQEQNITELPEYCKEVHKQIEEARNKPENWRKNDEYSKLITIKSECE